MESYGGSIISGSFRVGDKIEINPGILVSEHGFKKYEPVITTILSIRSENKDLNTGLPGGLIALGLNIDPCLTKDDRFVGQLVKRANDTNIVATNSITMKCQFFKTETKKSSKGLVKVGDTLRINVLALTVDTKVTLVKKSRIRVESDIPIFVEDQQRISISKQDGLNVHSGRSAGHMERLLADGSNLHAHRHQGSYARQLIVNAMSPSLRVIAEGGAIPLVQHSTATRRSRATLLRAKATHVLDHVLRGGDDRLDDPAVHAR